MIKYFFTVIVLLGLTVGCVAPFENEIKTPYVASKQRQEFIKNNITRIHAGMPQKAVVEIMGVPDEKMNVFNSIESMKANKPVAYSYVYLLQRLNNNGSYIEKKEKCFKVIIANDKQRFSVIHVEDETGKKYK